MAKRHGIILKTPEQIEKMRAAGRVVRKVHEHCRSICKPGITTQEIDDQALVIINESGGNSPILSVGVGGYLCAATMPDGQVQTVLMEVGRCIEVDGASKGLVNPMELMLFGQKREESDVFVDLKRGNIINEVTGAKV